MGGRRRERCGDSLALRGGEDGLMVGSRLFDGKEGPQLLGTWMDGLRVVVGRDCRET